MSDNPLTALFASRTLLRLLSVLLLNPERAYYQQELAVMTESSLRPLQLALAKLTKMDLVSKKLVGKHAYYQIVATHPAYPDLRSLFEKTFALADVVRDALEPLSGRIEVAFVYGSAARGEERASSDIDVFIAGEVGRKEVSRCLAGVEERLRREVNVVVFDRERIRESLSDGNPFLEEVLATPKIWLIGDECELERVVS